jgi:SAM-dependent methyltransferase
MNEWKAFFNGYAPHYDGEIFTKNTAEEIPFLLEELRLPEGGTILDMGCGTGRHAVALAKLGFRVTGVDISHSMLTVARTRAEKAGVTVRWIESDARDFTATERYDGVICLCEGALCLLGSADDPFERDLRILKNIYDALKPEARFITTVLNACRAIRAACDDDVMSGRFDPVTLIERSEVEILRAGEGKGEGQKKVPVRERLYTPAEFVRMLRQIGFRVDHVFSGTAGTWRREPVKLDEIEFMVIARRRRTE